MADIFSVATDSVSSSPWPRVLEHLQVSREHGLNDAEAARRLTQFGPNRLRQPREESAWIILVRQLRSLITVLLVLASALSFLFDQWMEGGAIILVIAVNSLIGFFTELKAVRSMEALHQLGSVTTRVRRSARVIEIPAEELVPGDIVILEGGDLITADLRLIEASKLQADESVLTGESLPVSKLTDPLEEGIPLAERYNMLFKGTAVTRGSAQAVVVATGMDTELGQVSSLVEEATEESTPLEKRLDRLARTLIWITTVIAGLVVTTGVVAGKETFLMIETGIALAVATIPEGLSIVATIALARGMWRMASRNALINRLSAVETLGATNVIFTDKTGTLTENLMTVTQFSLDCGDVRVEPVPRNHHFFTIDGTPRDPLECKPLREALEVGVLCNNASLPHTDVESTKATGDPLEVALLSTAAKAGIHRETFIESTPEVREEAFDSDAKMMATFHRSGNDYRVAVKGAPESVLEVSSKVLGERGEKELGEEERGRWKQQNELLASQGLRVLALATKKTDRPEESPYRDLTFLGLVGLADPPRKDVEAAVTSCRNGGIRVIMATGDQPVTARNVALAVGLLDKDEPNVVHGKDLEQAGDLSETSRLRLLRATVFARVSPKQKLDLITIHQKAGSIVAMTGDGVNDAPALKKADIGIAMGQRGTQVAREAADMVLKDDAFSTIVEAIRQGRIIFDNIRKFVLYLISCNISEVMIISLAAAVNAPLPILPLQILFLNFVTDVFPALALGLGEGDQGIMSRLPRDPGEPILSRAHWLAAAGYGLLITISVLSAFAVAFRLLDMESNQAVTISFLTLAFAQLWHVFNMRERGSSFFRNDVLRNPFVWGALVLCTGFLVAAVYVPGLSTVLKVVHPGRNGWILVLTMSAIPWVCGQILKAIRSGK